MLTFREHLLLEDRTDALMAKYRAKFHHALMNHPDFSLWRSQSDLITNDEVFNKWYADFMMFVKSHDPTDNKIYVDWMLRQSLRGIRRFIEDSQAIRNDLRSYDRVKRHMPVNQRDINQFKTYHDLRTALIPYEEAELKSKNEIKRNEVAEFKKEITKVYEGPEGRIYIPKSEKASMYLGRGTQWCTAATGHNYFHHYDKQGPLYVIILADGKKYQFHEPSDQLMNEQDLPIDYEEFSHKHPWVFREIFKGTTMQDLLSVISTVKHLKYHKHLLTFATAQQIYDLATSKSIGTAEYLFKNYPSPELAKIAEKAMVKLANALSITAHEEPFDVWNDYDHLRLLFDKRVKFTVRVSAYTDWMLLHLPVAKKMIPESTMHLIRKKVINAVEKLVSEHTADGKLVMFRFFDLVDLLESLEIESHDLPRLTKNAANAYAKLNGEFKDRINGKSGSAEDQKLAHDHVMKISKVVANMMLWHT